MAEAVLWTAWVHQGDAQALTECQLITIDASTFSERIRSNTSMWSMIHRYGLKFVEALNRQDRESLTDLADENFNPKDIMDDLASSRSSKFTVLDNHLEER